MSSDAFVSAKSAGKFSEKRKETFLSPSFTDSEAVLNSFENASYTAFWKELSILRAHCASRPPTQLLLFVRGVAYGLQIEKSTKVQVSHHVP